jgi:hypothetical protein
MSHIILKMKINNNYIISIIPVLYCINADVSKNVI